MTHSTFVQIVDSFAKIYTPIVVLLAFSMCTIPWAFGTETGIFWSRNGLITMVSARSIVFYEIPYL